MHICHLLESLFFSSASCSIAKLTDLNLKPAIKHHSDSPYLFIKSFLTLFIYKVVYKAKTSPIYLFIFAFLGSLFIKDTVSMLCTGCTFGLF